MGALLAALVLAAAANTSTPAPLPSRVLPIPLIVVDEIPALDFDLYDARAALLEPEKYSEPVDHHSIFSLKKHVGFAGGYDNGIVHGSLGLYITVAELGRWNLGVTSPEIGFGRYPVYDKVKRRSTMQTESTILISLASVHYRGGYLNSIRKTWYLNLEQVFDTNGNYTGSQFGISFSN